MTKDSLQDPTFSAAVIGWQKQHGRHALPWQNTRDAYRIWLSEIMLQQTQVTAVIPYYVRFLESFPDVIALADAPLEEVMAHWSGLGYYSRARNLHRCARMVVDKHGAKFPADPALLAELPGIGRSTAAAITAFAYGTRAAILDGNVKRVFARVFGIDAFPGEKKVEDALWLRAEALLPEQGIEAYTQGLMDLGATLCTRGRPDCGVCPLRARCVALAQDRVAELPVKKPKKAIPEKSIAMLVITDGSAVLLEQRPPLGIWGGLLSLPEMDELAEHAGTAAEEAGERARRHGHVAAVEELAMFSHTFTHFRLHVRPLQVQLAERTAVSDPVHVWLPYAALSSAALPAPVKKLLTGLFAPRLL